MTRIEAVKKTRIIGAQTGSLSERNLGIRRFLNTTPPGSWVWQNSDKLNFAQTFDSEAIYKDHNCAQVVVVKVNKRSSDRDVWDVIEVVKMSPDERNWHNITTQ